MIAVNVPTEVGFNRIAQCPDCAGEGCAECDGEGKRAIDEVDWYPIVALAESGDSAGFSADILYFKDGRLWSVPAAACQVRGMLVRAPEDAEVAS